MAELKTRKGRGRSPPTHLTIGEREELAAIRADRQLYWPHLAGAFPGPRPEENAANFDAAERDAQRDENAREKDAEFVTLEKSIEFCELLISVLKESGAFSD